MAGQDAAAKKKMIKRKVEFPKQEQPVTYQARKVPRTVKFDETIEKEDEVYDFKNKKPTLGGSKKSEQGPSMMDLQQMAGRLPDEFHNTEFEKAHPELVQPAHYDHYNPKVEGFFGPGYSFEDAQRAVHDVHMQSHEAELAAERAALGIHLDGQTPYSTHQSTTTTVTADPYTASSPYITPVYSPHPAIEDARGRLDLYMPSS